MSSPDLPSTHWSLVRDAGQETGEAKRRALGDLLRQYLEPMVLHVRLKFGLRIDQAEDVVQSFVTDKVLDQDLCRAAEAARGKFRNFLLTALDRFAIDRHRAAARDHLAAAVPIDGQQAAAAATHDPHPDPDAAFDILWARKVVGDAVTHMEEHCRAAARPDVWDVFRARVLTDTFGDKPAASYAELAARYGWASQAQGSNVLVTAKRMFARTLRAIVGRYEREDEDIEREIQSIRQILASPGARSVR